MPDYSVSVPNTVQAGIYQNLDNRPIFSSLTFKRLDSVITFANVTELAVELRKWYEAHIQHWQSIDHRLDQCSVLSLDHAQFQVGGSTAPASFGDQISGSMPNNVGFRVEFKTALPGRAHRGWNTVIGVPRGRIKDNTIDVVFCDGVKNGYIAVMPIVAALGWKWVVVSTHIAGAPRVTGITTDITQVTYKDRIVDSCRHRLPNRRFS